jgi:3-oxoacyl-[acyl-carrier-protein] synthase-3
MAESKAGTSAGRLVGPGLGVAIADFAYYLPAGVITNEDLAKMVDTSNEWIVERTGIRSRHRAATEEATSDLAFHAANRAMERAGVLAADLDVLLVATATPDSPVPSTACLLQARLGAWRAAAMDLNAGCSGFLYALHTAACFVRAGAARRVLVLGAETLTRVTDYTDRRSCILFGDGAGAAIVTSPALAAVGHAGRAQWLDLVYSSLGTDGAEATLIDIPGGGSRRPASAETVSEKQHYLRLDGTAVFRQAVRRMTEAAREALEATGLTASDIAWILPHQANARIVTAVSDALGIDPARAMLDMAETGNTSAASIPITLGRARDSGQLRDGQRILMLAFGAGLTWACEVWQVREG